MKNSIATLLTCLYVYAPTFGAWQLIDNFQAFSDGNIFTDATEIGWYASAPEGTDEYWMLADPFDASNICMFVESGNYGVGYGNTWVMKELPDGGIAPGETGTIYFKCLWSGIDNNWHIGTADKELAFDAVTGYQTAPGSWGDYNALIRLGEAQNLEHRDGGGYVSTNPPKVITVNTWYHFWMVIGNTWDNSVSPPVSTGTHTLYVQGPEFGEVPTLVPVGTDPPKDAAFLRRAPTDVDGNPQPIKWVMFATNSGAPGSPNAGDPYLLDDFYFTKGTGPVLDIPCPTCPPVSSDIDTGDWMGWINTLNAPYLWSYSLNGWIYMEEPPADAPGGWGYIFK